MDRQVTPCKQVTSPIWGLPPILFHQTVNMNRVKTWTYGAVWKSYQSYLKEIELFREVENEGNF